MLNNTNTLFVTRGSSTRWVSNYAPPPREGNSNKHRSRAETRVCLSPPYPHSGLYRHTEIGRIGTPCIARYPAHPSVAILIRRLDLSGVHRGIPHARKPVRVVDTSKSRFSHTVYRACGALFAIISRSGVVGRSSRIKPKQIQIHRHRLASVLTDEI